MRWLTEKQVAEMIGVSLPTLWADRRQGKRLPYSKFGKSVRYCEADVISFMEANKVIHALPLRMAEARAKLDALKAKAGPKPEVYMLAQEVLALVQEVHALAAEKVPSEEDNLNFKQLMSDLEALLPGGDH